MLIPFTLQMNILKHKDNIKIMFLLMLILGHDSKVGTAARYGLDGPGIES
jgi:hypothetical protein